MARKLDIYQEYAGGYGWVCAYCRSESRKVYGDREHARDLAVLHQKRCKKRSRAV